MVTAECLSNIGHDGAIIVEGPFAGNQLYLEMLAVAAKSDVYRSSGTTGTSSGAALLVGDAMTTQVVNHRLVLVSEKRPRRFKTTRPVGGGTCSVDWDCHPLRTGLLAAISVLHGEKKQAEPRECPDICTIVCIRLHLTSLPQRTAGSAGRPAASRLNSGSPVWAVRVC